MPDEPEALSGPVDVAAPWTIKLISTVTRKAITDAARREGLTVGQWLERRVLDWEGAGSPVLMRAAPTATTTAGSTMTELADLMRAAREMAEAAGVPVPPGVARDSMNTLRQAMRQIRGLPTSRPRRLPPPEST